MELISIICPIYNEVHFIEKCIESILCQDYPKDSLELLLVDGGSTDSTRDIIETYTRKYAWIKMLDNPGRIAPCAMNIGIRAAKGEYVCRIDAHSSFPPNYISTLLHYIKTLPDAANVGAICRTMPRNNTAEAMAITTVLSNRLGVGSSSFRIGTDKVIETDTVPFGFYKKETLEKIGLYNEKLSRNQDIELNKRIIKNGGKIYLIPNIYCTYYARDTYKELFKNNFNNGRWNILTIHYTHDAHSISRRHYIPLFFILSIILPLPLMALNTYFGLISCISLLAYVFVTLITSIKAANETHIPFFYILWAFWTLHISYGIGSFVGIIEVAIKEREKKKV